MVDTRDLKSLGPQGLYEFESRPRHKKSSVLRCSFCARYLMNEGAFPKFGRNYSVNRLEIANNGVI